MSIYEENGYKNRQAYLKSLAEEYGLPFSVIMSAASALGPNEDFDGLITELEDMEDILGGRDFA